MGLKRVAITGVSGYLGTRLAGLLEKDEGISKIIGIDIRPPTASFSKLEFYALDINDPLDQILKLHEVDVLIHLVFMVDPIHDSKRMHRINVEGTKNVLNASEAAGVKRILMASSATAYGAHPDNPECFTEEDPLRGNLDYPYAHDKVLMEKLCHDYQQKHSECDMIIFRPAVIMGPHVNNFISRYMLKPIVFGIKGFDPLMQFVHEDDIAQIFYRFVREGGRGIYNIGADTPLKLSEIAKHFKRRLVNLPPFLVYPLTEAAWMFRLTPLAEAPSALLNFIRYPWVVDNRRLRREIGYQYQYSTAQALDAFIKTLGLH